jgi:hypothetical protein
MEPASISELVRSVLESTGSKKGIEMTKYQFIIVVFALIGAVVLGTKLEQNVLEHKTCQGLQVTFDKYPIKR